MKFRVGVISGDGIGPEIVKEAKKVLDKVGSEFGHEFEYEEILMGGCSIDATGVPLTDEAIEAAKTAGQKEKIQPKKGLIQKAVGAVETVLGGLLKKRG